MRIDNDKIRKKLTPKASVNDLIRNYMAKDLRRKPKRKSRHVGIEVECYGPMKRVDLQKLVLTMDLEQYVQIGDDASIRRPRGFSTYELRLLLPEGRLTPILNKISKLFKAAKLEVNSSCGLHVHIDMRTRSHLVCYARLLQFQDVLYSLVNKARWRNYFCQYARGPHEFGIKYRAVTGSSYGSKRTLEVRIHEGCVDTEKIDKWIKLLLHIVDTDGPKDEMPDATRESVLKWAKKSLRDYIKKTFNEKWKEEKNKYVKPPQGVPPPPPLQVERNVIAEPSWV